MITIKSISNTFKKMYENTVRKPAQTISAIIMACSLLFRPGLSTIISVGNIINYLSKGGLPIEDLPDGMKNNMNIIIRVIIDEIYRALREDAVIRATMSNEPINFIATSPVPPYIMHFTSFGYSNSANGAVR